MDLKKLAQESDYQWKIAPTGKMRVPAVIYGSPELMRDMDDKVYEQIVNESAAVGYVQPTMRISLKLILRGFADGSEIPARFTCDGEDLSPARGTENDAGHRHRRLQTPDAAGRLSAVSAEG